MRKTLFQNYSKGERIQMLEDNAARVENDTYMVQLSDEERREHQEKLSKLQAEIIATSKEQKEVATGYKNQLKELGSINGELVQILKVNAIEVDGRVFLMSNEDDRVMEIYNEDGVFVKSRPMTNSELQTSIFKLKKAE